MNNFVSKVMQRPVLWAGLFLLSIGAAFLCLRHFPDAFPILNLDLRMDRPAALAAARQLAERHSFTPTDYRQAASFDRDWSVQTYVELEAGGREAFQAMLQAGLYEPYTWSVRHFKPGDIHETWFYFTPRGAPYGFDIKLPEQEPGVALLAEAARTIAEQGAAQNWNIALNDYHLVEQSKDVRPGGRVDHAFVYERNQQSQIGEGRYRLSLTVGGDRLIALKHSVKIPEAFSRRYAQMRSANEVIGTIGGVGYYSYLVLGCGVGLIIALRRRLIIWRAPLYWGLVIAGLGLLNNLNYWPLIWQDYDTAMARSGFIGQFLLAIMSSFVYHAILGTLVFMAAETLTRRAFPHQLQLWRIWSPPVASSRSVLGRTLLGYLLVSLDLLFAIGLYTLMRNWQHWWNPSDILVEPNIMAMFCPWLFPLCIGADAGFTEECLFRAVPIAGAALLGKRFGGRGWWIAAAVLVQAVIFGACHATYAAQPAYARLVEILVPALAYAGLYLWLGLLPVILIHFGYDVVLCSIPLFASTAPGVWMDRGLLILLALVPLWIVLVARLRIGRWQEGPASQAINGAWSPPSEPPRPETVAMLNIGQLSSALTRWTPLIGLTGLLIIGAIGIRTASVSPPLMVKRAEAEARARQALGEHSVALDASWKIVSSTQADVADDHRFIWQTAGAQTYGSLLGTYLKPPRWDVRFARFEGDVAERAEEYHVLIAPTQVVYRFSHQLPEERPGATLSEGQARRRAVAAAGKLLQRDAGTFREVSATPSKLKARTDWTFTFQDPLTSSLKEGELRLDVEIAGDQVVDVYRYVHVPETWSRRDRSAETTADIVYFALIGLMAVSLAIGFFVELFHWGHCRVAVGLMVVVFVCLSLLDGARWINQWPAMIFNFSTAQPWLDQVWKSSGIRLLIKMIVVPAFFALIAAMAWRPDQKPATTLVPRDVWVWGLALGAGFAAIMALGDWLNLHYAPPWSEYGALNAGHPWLMPALETVSLYLKMVFVALLFIKVMNRLTLQWTRWQGLGLLLIALLGVSMAGALFAEHRDWLWLLVGAGLALFLYGAFLFVWRYHPELLIPALGVAMIISLIGDGAAPAYPHALLANGLAVVLTGLAAWGVYAAMNVQTRK
ncbi:MAG: CPBP family intramembrane metalloprotease [Kiritimatiellaeota bacterium]|nr:CPBP family intramembrane metalloprotease [Kiritimatiellota bacterium]